MSTTKTINNNLSSNSAKTIRSHFHKLKHLNHLKHLKSLSLLAITILYGLSLFTPAFASAHATPAPTDAPGFVSLWDTKDIDGNDNNCPNYLAVDSTDNTYMSPACSAYISKFDTSGNPVLRFGSPYGGGNGNGSFGQTAGMAIDSQGNIYVADSYNNIIQKFGNNGTYVSKLGVDKFHTTADGQLSYPKDVAVDSQDNVYVADTGNNRIQKFSSNGTFLTKFGSYGPGDGQFEDNSLVSIAIGSSGNIYAADLVNNRVEKFDASGKYLSQFGTEGTGDGQFKFPAGIAIDSIGNVYVTDFSNNRVEKFDASGNYLSQFGSSGTGNGQFSMPRGIAIDSKDNIYVGDDSRIQKFAYPDHVSLSSAPNSGSATADAISLTTPAGTNITCSSSATETAQSTQDPTYTYPLGLVNFCFDTSSPSNEVTLTFQTDLKPNQVTPRKYNPVAKTYSDLPASANATITETTSNGHHALQLTYTITDNGSLDQDPAIGSIKDPVGLATKTSSTNPIAANTTNLPDTGQNELLYSLLAITIILAAFAGLALTKRTRSQSH